MNKLQAEVINTQNSYLLIILVHFTVISVLEVVDICGLCGVEVQYDCVLCCLVASHWQLDFSRVRHHSMEIIKCCK